MAQSSLRTLPQQIASVGHTVDGREITEEDIDQIVEQYNPKIYGARINLDHYGNWGAFFAEDYQGVKLNGCMLGDVISVAKDKDEDGTTVLTAILCPNESLLKLNQADQAVYYSIEINRDFMKTGKTYLVGLAMTDYPASTRTTRANFNTKNGEQDSKPRCQLELKMQQKESWLSNLFKSNKPQTQAQDESDMNQQQIQQLGEVFKTAIAPLGSQLTDLSNQLSTFAATGGEEEQEKTGGDNTPKGNEDFSAQKEINNLTDKFNTLEQNISNLSSQLEKALKEPGSQVTDGEDEQTGENAEYATLT